MNKKFLLCFVLAVALCFGAAFSFGISQANAIDVSIDRLFTVLSGSTTDIEYDEEGVLITVPYSTLTASVTYVQNASMEVFKLDFNANKRFTSMSFVFTDINDDSNSITLFIEKTLSGISAYTKKGDIEEVKTDITDVVLPVDETKTTDDDMYAFSLEYRPYNLETGVIRSFKLNGLDLEGRIDFEYNVAIMDIYTTKAAVNEEDQDTLILVKSLTNKIGTQVFTQEAEEIGLLVWQRALPKMPEGVVGEGDFEGKTVYTYNDLVAKVGSEYVFPVFAISMIGSTSSVSTAVYEEAEEEESGWRLLSETLRTKYTFGSEEALYRVIFSTDNEVHILMVRAIEDTVAPLFNELVLVNHIRSNIKQGVVYTSDGFTVPTLRNEDDDAFLNHLFIFPEEDKGIDTYENVSVRLGYKKPAATDWTWTSLYAPTLDAEGQWAFKYKVIDASGNETESDYEFVIEVIDNTPPTITATENLTAYLDTVYTVATPTITDVGVGVDTSKTVIRLYKGIRGSEDAELIDLSVGYKFVPDVLTAEDEDYSYYIEYIAYDYIGNESERVYSYITVTEPKVEDAEGPDWLIIGLIVFSVIIMAAILALLLYKPKDKSENAPKKYISKK